MAKCVVPDLDVWRQGLARPDRHWRTGYSAKALAHCWFDAQGFPASVKQVFTQSGIPFFEALEPIEIIPEHKVPLPGGNACSQNDIWILGESTNGHISISVEGKVAEDFGDKTLGQWLVNPSPGKLKRFAYLRDVLNFSGNPPLSTRYQLIHRTASAVIMAKERKADHAMMLVHSFSQTDARFRDYAEFVSLFGAQARTNSITDAGRRNNVQLYFAWVRGEECYLTA
jgi:hypothetical protein